MYYVADANRLLSEGVLTPEQVDVLRRQAREAMMKLGVNTLLTGGVLAATAGLILWLAAPLPVALSGLLALAFGLVSLARGGETLGFFGNASALIGAGLLLGGAGVELAHNHETVAGPAMLALGAVVAAIFGTAYRRPRLTSRFACGSIFLMGIALHLAGLVFLAEQGGWTGWSAAFLWLYAATAIAGAGLWTDVRLVTALAIVPFAQALSTGTDYWHAVYVFYSPESTLSILQMSVLVVLGTLAATRLAPRWGRHGAILAIMAAIVANLCALVGSLWGDWVGQTLWGPGNSSWRFDGTHDAYRAALDAYRATAFHIPDAVYAILWAAALAVLAIWSAHAGRRGLFNTALTFGGIHAYTQAFESFGDEPLAYVIGGLAAIPLAWGIWQVDRRVMAPRA